jgi:hypothetical protein
VTVLRISQYSNNREKSGDYSNRPLEVGEQQAQAELAKLDMDAPTAVLQFKTERAG